MLINLVGVELIALDEDSTWFDPDVVDALRAELLLIWVNSETLTTGVLVRGLRRREGPRPQPFWWRGRNCWNRVDAIQTEYPWLLLHELRRLRA